MTHSIVPVHLAVRAMRDNGYKNAAYAIAELMDNSIQAGAKHVQLLCAEKSINTAQKVMQQIYQIAVLDDARGMDKETLRIALQFGNGTRLEEKDQTGIGRFGMGLPASSISQCTRVEVWTWQDGVKNAIYTYLDLNEITDQRLSEVPTPKKMKIPDIWLETGKDYGQSGTIVVWSNLDRVVWRTAKAIINNSEFIIGRMYRKFIQNDKIKIRLLRFNYDRPVEAEETYVRPNDPGYLMKNTSTPAPWNLEPMFEVHGDENDVVNIKKIKYKGKEHQVKITYSRAKKEARDTRGGDAGGQAHGKHAGRNLGVSVMRADRELELDDSWTSPSDPRERWWGIEVDFPPGLDDVFGVTNNKQHAHNFSELIKELDEEQSKDILLQQFIDADDPRAALVHLVWDIRKTRNYMREEIKRQRAGERMVKRTRHDRLAEERATEVTQNRKADHRGASDADEALPVEQRKQQIKEELINQGMDEADAKNAAAEVTDDGLKYRFHAARIDSSAFFTTTQKGGAIIITLNTGHPAYDMLLEVLSENVEQMTFEELQERFRNTVDGLKLVLMAWARYEDEQPDGRLRDSTQDARADWGKVARQFLKGT